MACAGAWRAPATRPNEAEFVERAKRGDHDAYESLMREHEEAAFRAAFYDELLRREERRRVLASVNRLPKVRVWRGLQRPPSATDALELT
jgi:hypothetical protein